MEFTASAKASVLSGLDNLRDQLAVLDSVEALQAQIEAQAAQILTLQTSIAAQADEIGTLGEKLAAGLSSAQALVLALS